MLQLCDHTGIHKHTMTKAKMVVFTSEPRIASSAAFPLLDREKRTRYEFRRHDTCSPGDANRRLRQRGHDFLLSSALDYCPSYRHQSSIIEWAYVAFIGQSHMKSLVTADTASSDKSRLHRAHEVEASVANADVGSKAHAMLDFRGRRLRWRERGWSDVFV